MEVLTLTDTGVNMKRDLVIFQMMIKTQQEKFG